MPSAGTCSVPVARTSALPAFVTFTTSRRAPASPTIAADVTARCGASAPGTSTSTPRTRCDSIVTSTATLDDPESVALPAAARAETLMPPRCCPPGAPAGTRTANETCACLPAPRVTAGTSGWIHVPTPAGVSDGRP